MLKLDRIATPEEVKRVRLTECIERGGHSYQVYVDEEQLPTHVHCLFCKQDWKVEQDDA